MGYGGLGFEGYGAFPAAYGYGGLGFEGLGAWGDYPIAGAWGGAYGLGGFDAPFGAFAPFDAYAYTAPNAWAGAEAAAYDFGAFPYAGAYGAYGAYGAFPYAGYAGFW